MRFSKQNSFSSQAKHTGWQASRMILEKTIIQLSMSTVSGAPERLFTWKQKELWNIWLPKCRSFLKTERSKEYIAIIIHSNPWKSHKTERDLNIHYRERERSIMSLAAGSEISNYWRWVVSKCFTIHLLSCIHHVVWGCLIDFSVWSEFLKYVYVPIHNEGHVFHLLIIMKLNIHVM